MSSKRDSTTEQRARFVVKCASLPVIALVLAICWNLVPQRQHHFAPTQEVISEIATTLEHIRNHEAMSSFRGFIADYEKDVDSTVAMIEEGLTHAHGQEVDFILQEHVLPGNPYPTDPGSRLLRCQQEIYRLLVDGHYDVVASESFSAEHITLDEIDKETFKKLPKLGIPLTEELRKKIRGAAVAFFPVCGALRFCIDHPTTESLGCERESVKQLHSWLYTMGSKVGPLIPETKNLDAELTKLRSQIALARLLVRLDAVHKRRGVLVIGRGHQPELEAYRSLLGLKGKTLCAIPLN